MFNERMTTNELFEALQALLESGQQSESSPAGDSHHDLIRGLQIHQLELEIQNRELRATQSAGLRLLFSQTTLQQLPKSLTLLVMTSGSRSFENAHEQFRRGRALAKNGLWKEALTAYKESLRLNPNSAQTYLSLGFVYYELGYDEEAQEAFERASRLEAGPYKR